MTQPTEARTPQVELQTWLNENMIRHSAECETAIGRDMSRIINSGNLDVDRLRSLTDRLDAVQGEAGAYELARDHVTEDPGVALAAVRQRLVMTAMGVTDSSWARSRCLGFQAGARRVMEVIDSLSS